MRNRSFTLRTAAAAAALVAALAAPAASADGALPAIVQLLETSQRESRGVILYVGGQAIAGAVVRIEGSAWVELRSKQYGRIVVRLDRVDAVAMS